MAGSDSRDRIPCQESSSVHYRLDSGFKVNSVTTPFSNYNSKTFDENTEPAVAARDARALLLNAAPYALTTK